MSSIQPVPQHLVHHAWDRVSDYIAKGLVRSGGEYSAEQLKVYLIQGSQVLMVILDDANEIKGAMTVQLISYPNKRIAYITALGGATYEGSWNQFIEWARLNGCSAIRGAAFDSVARLWKRKFGFQSRYVMVEKEI